MRITCAHAGYGMDETTSDEDVRAIDGTVNFRVGSAHFQVKCTTKSFSPKSESITWPITEGWVDSWRRAMAPVYFVIVKVKTQDLWTQHLDAHTMLDATAFWTPVPLDIKRKSIVVPRASRFTTETLRQWASSREADFEMRAS